MSVGGWVGGRESEKERESEIGGWNSGRGWEEEGKEREIYIEKGIEGGREREIEREISDGERE